MENKRRKSDTKACKEIEAFEVDESSAFQQSVSNTSDTFDEFDLDTGWAWVVMFAAFGTAIASGGISYSTGLIHSILLKNSSVRWLLQRWPVR